MQRPVTVEDRSGQGDEGIGGVGIRVVRRRTAVEDALDYRHTTYYDLFEREFEK